MTAAASLDVPADPVDLDPPRPAVVEAVTRALAEDLLPLGDLTAALVPATATARLSVVSRAVGVVAGRACALEAFRQVDPSLEVEWVIGDGGAVAPGDRVAGVVGPLRSILTAERTVLNFLGHLSGVASLTRSYVDAVRAANPATRVLDTRKTTPGLRALEKAAVRAGGGHNHRGSLSDAVLVKDNHLAGLSIGEAVSRARERWPGRMVEVECDRPDQVDEAAAAGATVVMLDNMTAGEVAGCVARLRSAGSDALVEVSGGVDLSVAPAMAAAGADLVSVGALTHSAPVLDLGFDLAVSHGGEGLTMLLAIDVGNTETVVGLFGDDPSELSGATGPRDGNEPTGLAHHWRLSTVAERTADEHALLLTQLLDLDGLDIDDAVTGIAVTSSVPLVTANLRQMVARWFDVPAVVLEPGVKSGMPILYDNPKEVGADRIANAVGAHDLFGGPCVVVDLGTATTFDAISEAGEYLGGAITPGVAISLDALFAHAAALRRVELVEPRSVIGKSTVESIQSGALYGFAGQVDGLCRRFAAVLGPCTVVATGGLSELISPYADEIEYVEPWLTLHGLRIIFDRNQP